MARDVHVKPQSLPLVALRFMNDDHAAEARLLNEVIDAIEDHRAGKGGIEHVISTFDSFCLHTREHFLREERKMLESGFPPYAMHKAEHDRVIEEMDSEAEHFRETGDLRRLWDYASDAMPRWFVGHIESMDQVTAGFVAARGG